MANAGVVHKMQSDGLVVAKPRLYAPRFPWRGLVLLTFAVFVFKGYVHYALGEADFNQRISALSEGTVFEQVGGLAMFADPMTLAISELLNKFIG
ncbi:hypothetical protein K3729_16385 [Rhodobacteraceae bacterium S2214]|nr:hypothetical protein K3729_16385 [Rhodobacteraceae bacterium S2214]